MHLIRNFQIRYRNIRLITAVIVLLLLIVTFPWYWANTMNEAQGILGLPLPYFFSLLLMPAALLIILVFFARLADDVDHHTVEFENE